MPRWDDPSLQVGTMARTALWLVQEVGEGNTFGKGQLREAFSGTAQVDRRLRDLRSFGWVIHTNNDDILLNSAEQRFVKAGVAVWESAARRKVESGKRLTAKQRIGVMSRDGYMCVVCGVYGGEAYPDSQSETAVLLVSSQDEVPITLCKRCRSGITATSSPYFRSRDLKDRMESLTRAELDELDSWMGAGRRKPSKLDMVWRALCHLDATDREDIEHQIASLRARKARDV